MIFCKHQFNQAFEQTKGIVVNMTEIECNKAIGCTMQEHRKPGMNRILVQKIDKERKTAGGLFLADTFESPTQASKILAVGECKGSYEVGHYCYYARHAGVEIGVDEVVILEGDVIYTEKPNE